MSEPRLTRAERRRIAAEVKGSLERADGQIYSEDAVRMATEWVPPKPGARVTADYTLVKAIDRFIAGEFSDEDLFRCRVIAFYMVFGVGGEEWARMGVAFGLRMGG
jgi:hypothetical protein